MNTETIFKLIFATVFVVAVFTAAMTAKRASAMHGGSLNQLTYEVRGLIAVRAALGLVFYSALMCWLFWPNACRWMYLPLPMSVRWSGALLMVPALSFFVWAFRSIGTNYRGGVGLYDRHELVTTGAYRWMRHPIYATFIVVMVLVGPLSSNWLLGASGLALVVAIAAARIPIEERELHARFGSAWEQYRQSHNGIL